MLLYILMTLYVVWCGVLSTLFWMRRHLEPIASRGWGATLVSTGFGAVVFVIFCAYGEILLTGQTVSCFFVSVPGVLLVPAWWGPYCARCFMLYHKNREQQAHLKGLHDDAFLKHKWILNSFVWWSIFFLFFLLALVALLLVELVPAGGAERFVSSQAIICTGSWTYVVMVEAGIGIIITLCFCYLLFSVQDNYGLKDELRNLFIAVVPVIILWAIQAISHFGPAFPNYCWPLVIVFFGTIGSLLVPILMTYSPFYSLVKTKRAMVENGPLLPKHRQRHHQLVLRDAENEKTSLDVLTNKSVLEVLLLDANLMAEFKSFAANCWCIENVLFYEEVRKFCLISDEQSLKTEAQRLASTFIDLDAPLQLNLDGAVLEKIKSNMKNGVYSNTLFAEAEEKVLQIILSDTLYKWRRTKGFITALQASSFANQIDFSHDKFSSIPLTSVSTASSIREDSFMSPSSSVQFHSVSVQ